MTNYLANLIPHSRFYTQQEILDTLYFRNGQRVDSYKAYLLDRNDIKIGEIPIESGNISFSALGQIKRSGTFKTRYNKDIDYLTNRLHPHFILKMPKEDIEFPLGIFLIATSPPVDTGYGIDSELQVFDKTIILSRNTLEKPLTIAAGTNIVNYCVRLLAEMGFVRISAIANDAVTGRTIILDPATSMLEVINTLLKMINYNGIYFDRNGFAVIEPYTLPIERSIDIEYIADSASSVITPGFVNELNLFDIPNKFNVVSVNNETEAILTATFENRNPLSPVSIDRVGWINSMDYEVSDITDQMVLNDYIKRLAYNYSEKYNKTTFTTPNMPFHDYYNCLYLGYPRFDINARYLETSWTMNFTGDMKHEARRKVDI